MPNNITPILGVGFASMVLGMMLMGIAFFLYTPIDQDYAGVGMAAGFLLWCVVVFLMRLKAERLPLVFALVAYGLGIGPAIACAGGMFVANGALDPNDLVEARVEIVEKWDIGRGSERSSHVRVSDWREGRQNETAEFQLFEPELFQGLGKGDHVILRVGPGLFGWWYEDMQPGPSQQSSR
jgi:hypothetical protein